MVTPRSLTSGTIRTSYNRLYYSVFCVKDLTFVYAEKHFPFISPLGSFAEGSECLVRRPRISNRSIDVEVIF